MLNSSAFSERYAEILTWYRADPRVSDKFLLRSPFPILLISFAYWYFVKRLGPKLMENREPLELRTAMLIYNAMQVIVNIYLIVAVTNSMINHPLFADLLCIPDDPHIRDNRDISGSYIYVLLKLADYMDTIFMVLRKRFKQISFLHVYHHIMMSISCTLYLGKFVRGAPYMIGYANCYVHAIMYAYYFVSTFSSGLKQSLWWKKYLTQIQILQFFIILIYAVLSIFHKTCEQPRTILYFIALQAIVMIILFSNYYYKAYLKKSTFKLKSQ